MTSLSEVIITEKIAIIFGYFSGKLAPSPKRGYVYCGQTAGRINMPFGTEIDLGRGHIVLDGDPAPGRGTIPSSSFWPMFIVAKRLPISATAERL